MSRKYEKIWSQRGKRCYRSLLFLLGMGVVTPGILAQTIVVDDFDDGDDVGWTRFDYCHDQPYGPSIFDASQGFYHLRSTGKVPTGTQTGMRAAFDGDGTTEFDNGYLRAKIKLNNEYNTASIALRAEPPYYGNGYGYNFFVNTGCHCMGLQKYDGQDYVPMAFVGKQANAGEEWMVELGAVNDTISIKAWKVDEKEPQEPDAVVQDSTRQKGQITVTALTSFQPHPVSVDVMIDDISFRFPDAVPRFKRGDSNDDGKVDMSDAVCILNWLFLGAAEPGCLAVTDTNGDSGADLSDAVYLLGHLFLGGPEPVPPFPACGPGTLPSDEELGCKTQPVNCP